MAKKPKNDTEEKLTQAEPEVDKKANPECEKLKAELEAKTKECEALDDRCKRLAAEFDNYKKRSLKERENMHSSLVADIVSGFLPVVDNLEKALEAKTDDENYKQGIELVLKQFKDVLKANGVTEIEAVGKTFDPELHEAVASVVDENLGEKEIKEEYRKGYQIGAKVIRHSMVAVAN